MTVRRAVLFVAAALVLASCNDNGASSPAPPSTASTSVSAAGAASTTVSEAPTTTAVPFVPKKTGTLIPYETGIFVRGADQTLAAYAFGADADAVRAAVTKAVGSSDRDTAWHKDDRCDGELTRRVTWGDLELVFSKGANGTEPTDLTFQQWYVSGRGARPTPLVSPEGIGIGSTVSDLKQAYKSVKVAKPKRSDDLGLFISVPEGGPFMQGFTTDTTDKGAITSMWAGLACQRVE